MKSYNKQLVRRKYLTEYSATLPKFKGGGKLKQFGNWAKDHKKSVIGGALVATGVGAGVGAAMIATDRNTKVGKWVEDNEQGVIGGLKVAGGTALIASGIGAGAGAGLIASGAGDIYGEIQKDKLAKQLKNNQPGLDSPAEIATIGPTPEELAAQQAAASEAEMNRQLELKQAATAEAERSRLSNVDAASSILQKPVEADTRNFNELSTISYRKGGLVKPSKKFVTGGQIQGEANAELERGEPFMTPDGSINNISENAPTHEQGGVPVALPDNTKIIGQQENGSEELKIAGVKLAKAQKKYKKILEERPTAINRRTAERTLNNITLDFENMFLDQQLNKLLA